MSIIDSINRIMKSFYCIPDKIRVIESFTHPILIWSKIVYFDLSRHQMKFFKISPRPILVYFSFSMQPWVRKWTKIYFSILSKWAKRDFEHVIEEWLIDSYKVKSGPKFISHAYPTRETRLLHTLYWTKIYTPSYLEIIDTESGLWNRLATVDVL